jgi:hypothetical protein
MKLDVKAFALTCAVVWGLGLPLLTWWIIYFDGPSTNPTWIGQVYRGYNLTLVGSLIGAAWAFLDGLVGGALFAWVYDFIQGQAISAHRGLLDGQGIPANPAARAPRSA